MSNQIIWSQGINGDGRHNLFTKKLSDLEKMDETIYMMRYETVRLCNFGTTYKYYPSNAETLDINDFKEDDIELTHIYMWCYYYDRHNIGEYAIFKTKEDLLEHCDKIDKEIINDMETDLDELFTLVTNIKGKIEDTKTSKTYKGILNLWEKIKSTTDNIGSNKRYYKCYKIRTNEVSWSGDSILPDECYGCEELDIDNM